MRADAKNETLGYDLISKLHEKGVFKFGTFTLKSGLSSPIYIDLRVLISSPPILKLASRSLCELIKKSENPVAFDYILGVPYAALPLATLVCAELDAPMLLRRKEAKEYGTKKLIEGVYETGKKCLIIEDVVTSGSSIIETVDVLEKEGLKVTDVLIILDRQQGGVATLKAKGINVHSVMTIDAILNYLVEQNVINDEKKEEIVRALCSTTKVANAPIDWSLSSRLDIATNPMTKKLIEIMLLKKTNLCVAADFTTQEQILKLAAQIGAHICMLKLHVDIISDFSIDFIDRLTQIAKDNNFLLFEDRKLADTGKTVELQLTKGMYSISSWAHLVTVHSLPGQSVLQGLATAVGEEDSALGGCLLIAQLSTQGTLTGSAEYISGTLKLAKENAALVSGYICQRRCSDDPSVLYFTPGVHMGESGDGKGQQWRPPHEAIVVDRNDIVIVGRGVTLADDPVGQAQKYQRAAWDALQERDKE